MEGKGWKVGRGGKGGGRERGREGRREGRGGEGRVSWVAPPFVKS